MTRTRGEAGMRLPENDNVSARAKRILAAMRDDEDYGGELVNDRRIWMVGTQRFPQRDCLDVLRLCLVRDVSDEGGKGLYRYTMNEEGEHVLVDPRYCPLIVKALQA